jgi:predicted amidohydrolase YtcJ
MTMNASISLRTRRVLGACTVLGLVASLPAVAQQCYDETDLQLVNGDIHTMDADFSVVSNVRVANGRIISVGNSEPGPCTRVIDLDGRTVIPGIIDNHIHILLTGIRPGHETRAVENARNVAEAQAAIRARAAGVPEGEFISTVGGIAGHQFEEGRLPNLAELDAAAPNHPVYLHERFNGPGSTNSLGREFFISRGVPVDERGFIAAGGGMGMGYAIAENPSHDAFLAMDTVWSFDQRKQTTMAVIDYATSVGMTTAHSVGGSQGRGPGYFDTANDHDVLLSLLAEDNVNMRFRLYYNAFADELDDILNNIFPNFGGDLVKNAGLGEHLVEGPPEAAVPLGQEYIDRATKLAENGWQLMEHSFNQPNHDARAQAWTIVNETTPIADLRWSADHIYTIESETMDRFNDLGASLRLHTTSRYLGGGVGGPGGSGGPPFRYILDNLEYNGQTLHVGSGSDAAQAGPINPWLNIYYIVTGRDSTGTLVNDGQQATRQEAVWLYTAANGWFSFEEDDLGSIEVGKFGDLVVLNENYFDEDEVSDEEIRDIASVLTVVGGRIVHDTGVVD